MTQIVQGRDSFRLYGPAHVAGWKPYNLPYLGHASWVGSVPYTDPAQNIVTAG